MKTTKANRIEINNIFKIRTQIRILDNKKPLKLFHNFFNRNLKIYLFKNHFW